MKIKITIIGSKVHDVGYRPYLIAMADEFELDGLGVRNTEVEGKQAVRIKAEGDEECVREFEEAVKTRRPEGAVVSSVRSEPFDGRVPSIERTAITNMNLQLAKGITALNTISGTLTGMGGTLNEMGGTLNEMDGTLNRMDGKLDKMDGTLEKMDGTLTGMDGKVDQMLEKQDETISEIKGVRRDLAIDRGWQSRVDRDIKEIKAKIGLS